MVKWATLLDLSKNSLAAGPETSYGGPALTDLHSFDILPHHWHPAAMSPWGADRVWTRRNPGLSTDLVPENCEFVVKVMAGYCHYHFLQLFFSAYLWIWLNHAYQKLQVFWCRCTENPWYLCRLGWTKFHWIGWDLQLVFLNSKDNPRRIHGTGIFTYIYHDL